MLLVVTDAREHIQFVFADKSNVATCRFILNEDGSISVDAHPAGPLEGVGEADSDGITIEYSGGRHWARRPREPDRRSG